MATLEEKRKRITTIATWVAGGVCLAIAAPLIFLALKGLIALVAFALVGFLTINIAPVIGMKVGNWRLKAIKAEAAANPIETLQNLRIERAHALEVANRALVTIGTAVRNFADKVDKLKKKWGEEDPQVQNQIKNLDLLRKVEEVKKQQIQRGTKALADFDNEIEKAAAIWDAAQAGKLAGEAAKLNTGDIYEKIKEGTALDSVTSELNSVFAEMEATNNEEVSKLMSMADAPAISSHSEKTLGQRERAH